MLTKLKKHIKKILIGLGLIGVAFAGSELLPTDISLTEVPVVRTMDRQTALNTFKDKTGNEFQIEITKEEYDNHFNSGKVTYPTYPDSTWVKSEQNVGIYVDSMPILKDYQFFILDRTMASGTSPVLIKLPDQSAKEITGSYIVDDKLTPEALNTIK